MHYFQRINSSVLMKENQNLELLAIVEELFLNFNNLKDLKPIEA